MRNCYASVWLGVSLCTPGLAVQEDCEVLGTLDSGFRQGGLAYDGSALWVAEFYTPALHRVDPVSGLVLSTIQSPARFTGGLAWDGEALWAAPEQTGMLYRLDPQTGEVLRSIPAPTFGSPDPNGAGLAWDGSALWHADYAGRLLRRVDPLDGTVLASLSSPGNQPFGLAMKGEYLLIADNQLDELTCIDVTDGSIVSACPSPDTSPHGVAVDERGVAFVAGWTSQALHAVQLQRVEEPWSEVLCIGTPRELGESAHLLAEGSPSLAARDLRLTVDQVPDELVLMFVSRYHVERPFRGGTLCLGRPARLVGMRRARAGSAAFDLFERHRRHWRFGEDESWYFQGVYHDRAASGCGHLGITDALGITFQP